MAKIALLLDEDVRLVLGEILRRRGYDVIHVIEVGRAGKSDPDQLAYAVSRRRTILTHNIRDYWTQNTMKKARSTSASCFPIKFH